MITNNDFIQCSLNGKTIVLRKDKIIIMEEIKHDNPEFQEYYPDVKVMITYENKHTMPISPDNDLLISKSTTTLYCDEELEALTNQLKGR